jgi:hypothetical protein
MLKEGGDAVKRLFEENKACLASVGEFVARVGVDAGLGTLYYSGVGQVVRGGLLLAEGKAISTGLILTATARGPGSTGVGEMLLGRGLLGGGLAEIGLAVADLGNGISSIPGGNMNNFFKDGGFAACRQP